MIKLAEILELPSVEETTLLTNWDSLTVLSAMIAIDEANGCQVSGQSLSDCSTVLDVLRLAGAE